MLVKSVTLYTPSVERLRNFYINKMGFGLIRENSQSFTVQAGQSQLQFEEGEAAAPYHLAFNIPSNKAEDALLWLEHRVDVLPYQNEKLVNFESWQAKSIYFHDADKNIIEFIARQGIDIHSNEAFSPAQIVSVSEIGTPVRNVASAFFYLQQYLNIQEYDRHGEDFLAAGDEQGLFILVNYKNKTWIPAGDVALPMPYRMVLKNAGMPELALSFNHGYFSIEHDEN
jgi:catechol-2,3-dioxygenase